MSRNWVWIISLCILGLAVLRDLPRAQSAPPAAVTVYVDAVNGSNTAGNGTATQPWRTITYAMSHVSAGDTIQIQPGTYNTGLGEMFPIQVTPGVSLLGSGVMQTFVSGVSTTTVISLDASTTDILSDTVLSDFTIQNGATGLQLYAREYRTASPSVTRLLIRNNTTGIYMDTSGVYQYGATIMARISNTQVFSNTQQGIEIRAYGNYGPSTVAPTIINSAIQDNGSHGIYLHAVGSTLAPLLDGVNIQGNLGDGVLVHGSYGGVAQPQIESSWIENNTGYGWRWQSYINLGNFSADITNTVIAHNQAGGIYIGEVPGTGKFGQLRLVNSTLLENKNYGLFWERMWWPATPWVLNSILWNPDADDLYSTSTAWSEAEVQYSIIEDGDLDGQQGNLAQNPLLIGDHLSACSPARNAGASMGAPATDIDGEPRLGLPDIGVDEYEASCVLQTAKMVSPTTASWGDVVTYTVVVTNSTVLTPVTILLTDTLPTALAYLPDSLTATQGTVGDLGNVLTWSGALAFGETVTISLQSQITAANQTIHNFAVAEAVGFGVHRSPSAATLVRPVQTHLPIIFQQYCGGPSVDTFDNPGSGWPISTNAYWAYGYVGGEYQFLAQRGAAFGAVSRGERPTRFALEADVRQATAATGSFGLLFFLNEDWTDFYTFEIYPPTQDFAVFRYLNGSWQLITTAHRPDAILPGLNVNHLRIQFNSATTWDDLYGLYINGIQVFTMSWFPGSPARRVGLTATSDVVGLDARFDNYKLVWDGCPENLQMPAANLLPPAALELDRPSPWTSAP